MLHHQLALWLRTQGSDPKPLSDQNCWAGSAPPKKPCPYVVLDAPVLFDNGEKHVGQCRIKVEIQIINVFSDVSVVECEPIAQKIQEWLAPRQFAIGTAGSGYWIQAAVLHNQIPLDMQRDPQGGETGLSCIRLIYRIARRQL